MSMMRNSRLSRVTSAALSALLSVIGVTTTIGIADAQTAAKTAPQHGVTFTKDVAPLLQRACQNCHRPGSVGPMSLLTYEEARPWARSIKENVIKRQMPPWYIDKNVGIHEFKNDVSLSDQEIATIAAWVDGGSPKGNPADMPTALVFEENDRWHLGTPDMVITLPKDEFLGAKSPDTWKDILVDPGLTEDRWIQAVETKPTKGYTVVHHAATSLVADDEEGKISDGGIQGTFLNEYAVGKNADIFEDGAARLIKAGTKINFNIHLHANGKDTPLNLALALKFYPKGYVPKHVELTENVGYVTDLDLPPNTDNIRADRYFTLMKPTRLLAFQPHMHLRGKGMCVEAIYPGGGVNSDKVETLSCVNKYRFGWHIVYAYKDDLQPLLPAGTVLHLVSWHDNTSANKANPDPDNWIGFGQRSTDDMSFAWLSYFTLSDDEFKQMVLARREVQKKKAGVLSSRANE